MSAIEEAEYWTTRQRVREDILSVRNELLDIVARKSVIERRLEQMQSELVVLNGALVNEAYYLRLKYTKDANDDTDDYDALPMAQALPLPYGSYRDIVLEGTHTVQLYGQVRTVEGFRRVATDDDGTTGRYITDKANKNRYRLDDRVVAALCQQDADAFRQISRKDTDGQVLIQGEFGVVPSCYPDQPGTLCVDENDYYEALTRYYTDMAQLARRKTQDQTQHTAA